MRKERLKKDAMHVSIVFLILCFAHQCCFIPRHVNFNIWWGCAVEDERTRYVGEFRERANALPRASDFSLWKEHLTFLVASLFVG